MHQILQHLNTGKMDLAEVPCPAAGRGQVLIQTTRSLISAGTERMLVEFGQANLLQKARSQPDKVRQVLDKIRTDGLLPTLEAVFNRLGEPLPLGYCNVGVVSTEQADYETREGREREHTREGMVAHEAHELARMEGEQGDHRPPTTDHRLGPSGIAVPGDRQRSGDAGGGARMPSAASPEQSLVGCGESRLPTGGTQSEASNDPPQEGLLSAQREGAGHRSASASAPQVSGFIPPPSPARFPPGTRVVSNGAHAEVVCVPENLCARIPDNVTDEEAAFTVLASIGLQGVRLLAPTLGETVFVVGLGLIGLVTAQLLRASGCRVLGSDMSAERLRLAASFGVQPVNVAAGGDPVTAAMSATGGQGVDGVIITASAKTDGIMHQAAEMCRQRGRIVLVGVVPLNLRRDDFYKKELTFQVSCSYGPGRYDEKYEQGGQDYPLGFVRWTEQRNFEAVLGAMASGALDVRPLITHRFPLGEALKAYETIQHDPGALGVILEYPGPADRAQSIRMARQGSRVEGRGLGEQSDHGPQDHGTTGPRDHGTTGPQDYRTMDYRPRTTDHGPRATRTERPSPRRSAPPTLATCGRRG
jgi:threonine dehydrogenase-like Zn-dependent dehydrogenase